MQQDYQEKATQYNEMIKRIEILEKENIELKSKISDDNDKNDINELEI